MNTYKESDEFLNTITKYIYFEKYFGKLVDNFVKNRKTKKRIPFTQPVKQGCVVSALYVIRFNRDGKLYVGSTNDINSRIDSHELLLRKNKHHNKDVQKSYNEDQDISVFFILTNTREEAYDMEQWLLDRYWNSDLLFNLSPDARVAFKGLKHTDETKILLSKTHKGIGKGIPKTLEHRRKIGLANKGKPGPSEEHKAILREMAKNRVINDSTREKLRLAIIKRNTGHKHSKKTIEKMRLVKIGKKPSSESRQKMSLSNKKSKPVIINGVEYRSISYASRVLNLQFSTVYNRIRNSIYSNWKYK